MIPETDITSDIKLIQEEFDKRSEKQGGEFKLWVAHIHKAAQLETLAGGLVRQYNELLGLYNKRSTGFVDINGKAICVGDKLRSWATGNLITVEWSEKFGTWEAIEEDGSSRLLSEENLARMEIVGNIRTTERQTQTYRGYTITPFHHEWFWCNPQTYTVDFSPDRAGGICPEDSGNGSLAQCRTAIDEFLADA